MQSARSLHNGPSSPTVRLVRSDALNSKHWRAYDLALL